MSGLRFPAWLKFLWTVVLATAVIMLLALLQLAGDSDTNLASRRARWNERRVSDYLLKIVTIALPAPPIGLELTIRSGQIVSERIIACDTPSDEFPADLCAPIRRYYSQMGHYTVDQLFDLADDATSRTQRSLAKCQAFPMQGFHGFSNWDDLWEAAQLCQSVLQISDVLTSVEYGTDYGYPRKISRYIPQVMDGFFSIEIKEFHPLPPS